MTITRTETKHGTSYTLKVDGQPDQSLFVTKGAPFSPKQALINFAHRL